LSRESEKYCEHMRRYVLTEEGRARFRNIKAHMVTEGGAKMWGYEVLDYLYEHEPATEKEIQTSTGLSWIQVADRLGEFVTRGYVVGYAEKLADE